MKLNFLWQHQKMQRKILLVKHVKDHHHLKNQSLFHFCFRQQKIKNQNFVVSSRPKTSFLWFTSPWKTFRFVIWRNFKWPIIFGVILTIFVIFLLLAIWSLPGEIIRQISTKIFKTSGSRR